MASRFFLRSTVIPPVIGDSRSLSTQQGFGFASTNNATLAGPQSGIQVGAGLEWISAPLKAGTLSGNITFNLWGTESASDANVGFRADIQILGGSDIMDSSEGIELGLSPSAHNWIATLGSPFSYSDGNRFWFRVFGKDAGGTMGAGRSFSLHFDAPAGIDGDSWIEFQSTVVLQTFPTLSQGGPKPLKYTKRKKDYKEITVESAFEDGGVDLLEHAADASQRYELLYDGLSESDASVLDSFWDAHRLASSFTFIEPRNEPWTGIEGNTISDVYFESFEGDHEKLDTQSRKVVLIKRPA